MSYELQALAKETARKIKQFYENPENLKNFYEWREKRVQEKKKDTQLTNLK